MNTRLIRVLAVFVVLVGGVGPAMAATSDTAPAMQQENCSFPFTATDATGTEVTVDGELESVVALQPSAAQTMWEIGAEEKVVGMPVNSYTSSLEGVHARENVVNEDQFSVNVEKVVALDPDLVLAPNIVPDETVSKLREAGLTVYKFEAAASLDAVYEKTLLTGNLVGACEGATERVDAMKGQVAIVENATEGEDEPRVLYLTGGFTAGNGTFIHSLIERAGGQNVAAEAGITGYAQISDEVVAEQDPEFIVVDTGVPEPRVPEQAPYTETTAVKQGQIVTLDANELNQPAPRVVNPLAEMAKAFHPEAYAAANITETATATQTEANETTENSTETNADGPGFGVTAAVVALVAATLFALRRV
ncbi:PGF-CTERM-anchored ABC transporter substrate-binding protein [Haladaptatus sp. YSMS36]|uniref:PGF-CTERM-anchored ABC transporter substrate-binding protein n=1 Tax=Haladaptatus sp. YSMS36 TaxID=3033384 RepID=UPI0023E75EC3|nr:PGF-CTERM-anchored ABC transporter substrate-binding protein [Haladaptatus sp. YSMS36]